MLLDRNEIKRTCISEIKSHWMTAPDSFPTFLSKISAETKIQNELYIQAISDNFQKSVKRFPVNPMKRKKWKQKMFQMLEEVIFEETVVGIHNYITPQRIQTFQDEIKDFLVSVRAFAPDLSMEGIGQALRNYILHAMFVELNQTTPGLNAACFAYSMLYPFTDNYIDSQNYSDKEKDEYNQLIREKIKGKKVLPQTQHQQKTCELLSMIESKYLRDDDPSIFNLLLMMLEAQEESLYQQKKDIVLPIEKILDISLYKGGVSVLIDGFFVKNEITQDDLNFYLAFGFFLQLADDLQDIKEDSMNEHKTIMTADLISDSLEKIVNKMFHFVHQIMTDHHIENILFRDFVLSSCYQLVSASVVGSREFFSQGYLEKIEKHMPVSCVFLENMQKMQTDTPEIKIQDKYMKILDEMIH